MKKPVLMFTTHKVVNPSIAEQPFWVGTPILGTSVATGTIAQAVASDRGIPAEDVLYVYRRTNEVVADILKSGRNVNMELVGFSINLTGRFGSKDDPFKASRNTLEVSAYAKPILRDCLTGISARNVTTGLKANVFSVTDDQSYQEGVITVPRTVLLAGENILVDTAASDEGVWLVTKKNEIAATPAVLANTAASLDLDFGELPPDGDYTLVIKARSGASADFAPAIVRKAVVIRHN